MTEEKKIVKMDFALAQQIQSRIKEADAILEDYNYLKQKSTIAESILLLVKSGAIEPRRCIEEFNDCLSDPERLKLLESAGKQLTDVSFGKVSNIAAEPSIGSTPGSTSASFQTSKSAVGEVWEPGMKISLDRSGSIVDNLARKGKDAAVTNLLSSLRDIFPN